MMRWRQRGCTGVLAPFCVLVIFLVLTLTASYKPVIVIHGLFDSPSDFQLLLEFINETHPGTNVTVVDLFDRTESLKPLWMQVEGFRQAMYPIMENAVDGVHLICYSQDKIHYLGHFVSQNVRITDPKFRPLAQGAPGKPICVASRRSTRRTTFTGGLICRALLSTMPDHNVDTFLSLSSPQMGQYGDTKYLKWLFPEHMKSNLYRLCYTHVGQDFSICNYWNDPHHRDLYLNNSNFLALLNDERFHPNASAWKKNLLRIRKMVLVGGPDDGVIMPWESSLFAFYDDNETVREMKSQPVYLTDAFGLKTLDAHGDLVFCVMPGVSHTYWHSNRTVYDTCIVKWLT